MENEKLSGKQSGHEFSADRRVFGDPLYNRTADDCGMSARSTNPLHARNVRNAETHDQWQVGL